MDTSVADKENEIPSDGACDLGGRLERIESVLTLILLILLAEFLERSRME